MSPRGIVLSPGHTGRRPWRPGESTRSPCGGQISEKRRSVWLIQGLCWVRTALLRATFVSPTAFPLRPLRQYNAHTMTSRRPGHALSVTIGDHQQSECDHTAMLLRLRRPHYAAWMLLLHLLHTHGIHTMILRRPSVLCCTYGSIPWKARMFWTCIFLNANAWFLILKTKYDFI